MKILLVGHVPPHVGGKDQGGVAQHLWELAKKLNETYEVEVIAIGRYYKNTQKIDGILVHGLDKTDIKWIKCLKKNPGLLLRIGKAPSIKINLLAIYSLLRLSMVEELLKQADIIHIHGWKDMFLNALKVLNIQIPSVVTVHSYHGFISIDESKRRERIEFINRYYNLADALIHVSAADRKKGEKLGLKFEGKDHIIHNGIYVSKNSVAGERSGICFVGNLIPRKRIELLLNAIPLLNSEIGTFDIIGDGPQRKVVEKAAARDSRLTYHSVLPNTEVRKILSKSTVLVVPSISESFGLAYIEAVFEGAAVIGYDKTIKEFQDKLKLNDMEKNLFVPFPGEEAAPGMLAKKIESAYIFRESSEGDKAMKTLREKAITHFGWDSIVKKVEDVYKNLIHQN